MAEFTRSSIVKDHTTATEVIEENLPINPLSHLIIALDGYNVTDEATLAEIIAFINSVKVTQYGKTIINVQSEDLYGMNCYLYRKTPYLEGKLATDNYRRVLGLVVPFGRRIFDPSECFPSTKKGELKLYVDTTIPTSSLDNSTINIASIELPGANPQKYLKSVMHTIAAPGATGDNEWDLPIGNEIVAIQLRMTTFDQAGSHSYGVDEVSVLVDNNETGYVSSRTQDLAAEMAFRVNGQHGEVAAQGPVAPPDMVWIDYDPHGDGQWLLQTSGKSRVHTVLNMGVDEATYATVLELVSARGR